MLFHRATAALLAVSVGLLTSFVTGEERTVDENGNTDLRASSDRISWGDLVPADVAKALKDYCTDGDFGCSGKGDSGVLELDTNQIVKDGEYTYSRGQLLRVEAKDAQFKNDGNGTAKAFRELLEAYFGSDKAYKKETHHYREAHAGTACPAQGSGLCQTPEPEEGDLDQYMGPTYINMQLRGDDEGLIAFATLYFKLVEKNEHVGDYGENCGIILDGISSMLGPFAPYGWLLKTAICTALAPE